MLTAVFRKSSVLKNIFALLLPAVFIFNWAACESFCAEIAETHHDNPAAVSTAHLDDERCLSIADTSEGCTMIAFAAVVESRQNINSAEISTESLPVSSLRWSPIARSIAALPPEVRQDSPPKPPAPLYIRLRTLRI